MNKSNIHVFGGGTFSHVRNHLALAAPEALIPDLSATAFGETADSLVDLTNQWIAEHELGAKYAVFCHLTKMADRKSKIFTNEDVDAVVDQLISDPATKIIFFNAALCDFNGHVETLDEDGNIITESGKYAPRLQSRADELPSIKLSKANKVISKIRKTRKDIFLVAFKTTCGVSEDKQYIAGLNLLKENSCNLVLANDTVTRTNMIICPEEARYCVTTDREKALSTLVDMAMKRSTLHFTRSTVIEGQSIDWQSDEVPASLREVVDYCIEKGAYKPFRGSTAGHFAVKVDEKTFLTSKRSTNFNELDKIGLVKVISSGPDEVIAYGAKPSVGGQSQRIIFNEHEDVDCIVHFHCPPIDKADVERFTRQQYAYECGSHECGQNTSDGLKEIWTGIKAVYLDEHGPNIVFNRTVNPKRVISFIDTFFDLSQKTGGRVELAA